MILDILLSLLGFAIVVVFISETSHAIYKEMHEKDPFEDDENKDPSDDKFLYK